MAMAQAPNGAYIDGRPSRPGVIQAHGQGLTPTSQVVDPLRKAIHEALGMHTLPLQMPVIAGRHSSALFPGICHHFS